MSKSIKALVMRFLKNLKKYWLLGCVCVTVAIAFVCVTSLDGGMKSNDSKPLLGNHSITRIVWDFESADSVYTDGVAMETQVAVARGNLETLLKIGESGEFESAVNKGLKNLGFKKLSQNDVYEIAFAGHNVLEVSVYGTDAKRIEVIEEIVRTELIRITKDGFGAVLDVEVLKPVVFYAQKAGTEYALTSKMYELSQNNSQKNEETQKQSILTTNNILIVLSSVALWLAIVLLLTISDEKIYSQKDAENLDMICFGKLSKDKQRNSQIFSVIKKRVSDCESQLFQILVFGKEACVSENIFGDAGLEKTAVSNWGQDGMDMMDCKLPVLLAIRIGECAPDEIEEGLKALEILDVECVGCVLF